MKTKHFLNAIFTAFLFINAAFAGSLNNPQTTNSITFTQSGAGAVALTAQNKMRQIITPQDFGAVGDCTVNDTLAVQSAVNTLKAVMIPDGCYLIDTIIFPNSASDQLPLGGKFIGTSNVIFQQNTPNTPLFQKTATAGRAYNWIFGPFIVKPHSGSSSTVSAFFTSGFTSCTFDRIQGTSNGSAGFYAMFDLAASPGLSFFNTFNHPILVGTAGYTKAFHFNNNGTGNNGNSNANTINDPVIYNNTGMLVGIDANLSYGVTINRPYIEANSGMVAISMGVATNVNGGALETNGADFAYPPGANTPYGSIVNGTHLANPHTIDFGSSGGGNLWINVVEDGVATWINPGTGDQKINPIDIPAAPTLSITQTQGLAGTLSANTFNLTGPYTPFTRRPVEQGRITYTPPAGLGIAEVTFAAPAGWTVVSSSCGVLAAGVPVASRMSFNNGCIFNTTAVQSYFIDYQIELNRT